MADSYGEDFDEEEVWSASNFKDTIKEGSPKSRSANRLFDDSRMIARSKNISSSSNGRSLSKSSPVNIPHNCSKGFNNTTTSKGEAYEDEDAINDGDNVPPHEWLANKMARSQISSSSVCEGAGRTLKGRDLSKVRNAVLTKTGFLEE